jgi:anti-sigma regulatory factor (Ser/Thr protein kinase)
MAIIGFEPRKDTGPRLSTTLKLRIPPDPRHARTVRDAIIGFAALQGVSDGDLESLLFAIGEALANAIEHANAKAEIDVTCRIDDDQIVAQVIDFGNGTLRLPRAPVPLPEGLVERGRGIPIMQRCTDIFSVESLPGEGTAVTLGRYRRAYRQESGTAS